MEINQNIEVNIDELVLHGFSPADRVLIGQAVEHELTSMFSQQGVPPSLIKNNNVPFLNGGSFQMKANTSPGSIGNQIAGTVYSGLNSDKAV
ncbi:MAG: hypothetical protein ABIN93_02065 [Ginsengibacter sp.]